MRIPSAVGRLRAGASFILTLTLVGCGSGASGGGLETDAADAMAGVSSADGASDVDSTTGDASTESSDSDGSRDAPDAAANTSEDAALVDASESEAADASQEAPEVGATSGEAGDGAGYADVLTATDATTDSGPADAGRDAASDTEGSSDGPEVAEGGGAEAGASADASTDTGATSADGASGDGATGQDAGGDGSASNDGGNGNVVQNVFIIMMENHSTTSINGSSSAPYINTTLFPMGARATNYYTSVHPSEPNYIWLEAGDNLGITSDGDPATNGQTTTDHFVAQLTTANISWKAWVEDIDGTTCPLTSSALTSSAAFAASHTPQLFFSDVTDNFSTTSATCIAHVRPFTELATALSNGTVPRFNFITPNLCDDMEGKLTCSSNLVSAGDTWLKNNLPTILASSAYKNGGLVAILWDEGDQPLSGTASDGPIPLILLGSMVKTNYSSGVGYSHSSTLKSFEEIFGVPLLRGAADIATNDLADMFTRFP